MIDLTIEKMAAHVGEEIRLKGWIANRASKGKLHFIQMRDGSGFVQCVVFVNDVTPEVFALCDKLTQESSVIIEGVVKEDPRSPSGVELTVRNVVLVSKSEDFPIAPKDHGTSFLMDNRHLWLRSRKQHAIMRIRYEIEKSIMEYLDSEGFVRVDSPILTPAACEGTTTLFELEYFDQGKAYLTQSGQLYNEANAMALGRVYCFGPTFRAEKSKTRKHLNEFWMLEPEMAFADLDEVIRIAEGTVVYCIRKCLERRATELRALERDTVSLEKIKSPFPRVKHAEAVKIIRAAGVEMADREDFGAPQEEALGKHFGSPVVVTHWPQEIKAFYMKRDSQDPSVVLGADIIAPEGYGEIVGGSQREDDYDLLLARIKADNLPVEVFNWYLDLRKYGSVPHGGFGLGLERLVAWVCGTEHIRQCIPYPRTIYKIYP
ncbi:MAG: asparagine--tRNA ligase [Candidatus Brocadiia bacterium]